MSKFSRILLQFCAEWKLYYIENDIPFKNFSYECYFRILDCWKLHGLTWWQFELLRKGKLCLLDRLFCEFCFICSIMLSKKPESSCFIVKMNLHTSTFLDKSVFFNINPNDKAQVWKCFSRFIFVKFFDSPIFKTTCLNDVI